MLNSKFDIKTLVLIGLCIFLLIRNCTSKENSVGEKVEIQGKPYELIKHTVDTIYRERIVKVPTYIPKYITKIESNQVSNTVDIDSSNIVVDYFNTYEVKDTLNLTYDFPEATTDLNGKSLPSNLGYGILTDIVSQNKIQSRDIKWYFSIPTVYNTTVVKELPKTQVYYGLNLGFNKADLFNNVSGGLILKTKKDYLYQLNLGFQAQANSEIKPYLGVGMYWKLNLNKK